MIFPILEGNSPYMLVYDKIQKNTEICAMNKSQLMFYILGGKKGIYSLKESCFASVIIPDEVYPLLKQE